MVKVIIVRGSSKKRPGEVLEGGDHKKPKKMVNGVRTECGKIQETVKNPILKFKKAEEETSTITACSVIKPLVSREEKIKLKRELISAAMRGAWTGSLRWFLRKHGLIVSNREKIETTFNSFSDDTFLELSRALKGSIFHTSTENGKEDHGNAQQTMKITERKKLEQQSNIQSRISAARAAKEALLESAKSDLQLRRVKEREKLEKLERTVIIGDNLTFLKELENLCRYSGIKNPLEKIGLRLKEDYYYGYEYSDDDNSIISDELEDGEICDELEDGEVF